MNWVQVWRLSEGWEDAGRRVEVACEGAGWPGEAGIFRCWPIGVKSSSRGGGVVAKDGTKKLCARNGKFSFFFLFSFFFFLFSFFFFIVVYL